MRSLPKKAHHASRVTRYAFGGISAEKFICRYDKDRCADDDSDSIEEELRAFSGRDYYERRDRQKGNRSGSKPRMVNIGCGDIGLEMPKVRDAGGPFHSELLPPRVTRMEEIQDIIPLLYMNGLSTRK